MDQTAGGPTTPQVPKAISPSKGGHGRVKQAKEPLPEEGLNSDKHAEDQRPGGAVSPHTRVWVKGRLREGDNFAYCAILKVGGQIHTLVGAVAPGGGSLTGTCPPPLNANPVGLWAGATWPCGPRGRSGGSGGGRPSSVAGRRRADVSAHQSSGFRDTGGVRREIHSNTVVNIVPPKKKQALRWWSGHGQRSTSGKNG